MESAPRCEKRGKGPAAVLLWPQLACSALQHHRAASDPPASLHPAHLCLLAAATATTRWRSDDTRRGVGCESTA